MEEGFPETAILMPLGMGRQTSPLGCPVTDQFKIFCRGGSGKMADPCIDPPNSIWNISAIDGDMIADEEIFRNILLNPLPVLNLLFNGPSTILDGPDLMRGFLHGLAERGNWKKDEKEQDQEKHVL
jgi:hypothetical protein